MATGQSILDRMELVNQELQLQSGENDVTRGLLALNVAQDYFESQAALRPKLLGSGVGTVTTADDTETTTFPSGLLRIDRLQFIDATTSRPAWDVLPIKRVGGHARNQFWPSNLISSNSGGKPRAYWTNGTLIYWDPLPDATHTVRWYGLSAASDITAGGTFAYPDVVLFPLATFAVRVLKLGVDDAQQDIALLAQTVFEPVLDLLGNFNRDGFTELEYTEVHDV